MTIVYDPEQLAIDTILKLDRILRESVGESRCRSISRRAAEAPQLLLQTGLVSLLLFYISKSDENLLKTLLEHLEREGGVSDAKFSNSLREECEKEGKGYTIMTSILVKVVKNLANQKLLGEASNTCMNINDIRTIALCLKEVRSKHIELRVERLLQPFLTTMKRLAEALYGEKETGG